MMTMQRYDIAIAVHESCRRKMSIVPEKVCVYPA